MSSHNPSIVPPSSHLMELMTGSHDYPTTDAELDAELELAAEVDLFLDQIGYTYD